MSQEDDAREMKKRRMALGMSPVDFAAEADLSVNTVFRIESGNGGLYDSWDKYKKALERLEVKKETTAAE